VDASDASGKTALMCASRTRHVEIVRALLAAGAQKHLRAVDGSTAYSEASSTHDCTAAAIRELVDFAPYL
jgi:ankyrin repeat protein